MGEDRRQDKIGPPTAIPTAEVVTLVGAGKRVHREHPRGFVGDRQLRLLRRQHRRQRGAVAAAVPVPVRVVAAAGRSPRSRSGW